MLGINRKHKRVRKGPFKGRIVINLRRFGTYPHSWEATVSYGHGRAEWTENISFELQAYDAGRNSVTVTDRDFPDDRKLSLILNSEVDMPTFITNFILSGRW
jgi:hypothetical protein